jgi:hypothetical protein
MRALKNRLYKLASRDDEDRIEGFKITILTPGEADQTGSTLIW